MTILFGLMACVLAYTSGYMLGKGSIILPKRLTEEEKKLMKEYNERIEQYNKNLGGYFNE